MLELLLGQIPEAIFFALFMIYAKGLKEKRMLFIILMVVEYLLLKYSFKYNWLFQIGYMITTFLTLKVLYKEKSQITDVFILLIAYIIMIVSSMLIYFLIWFTINNFIIAMILHRLFLITFILIFKEKLINIQKVYKNIWNRNNNKRKIKTTTFRSINVFLFNIVFYIINLGMIFMLIQKGGV